MNKVKFEKFIKSTKNIIVKHSPEILTGLGIAGMITTTVLAVQATPKAIRLLDEAKDHGTGIVRKEDKREWEPRELTPMEVMKVAWKPYIPAAVTCVASISCIIGASSVHARRNAALATAYQLSTTALSEYKEKVVETIGEEQEKKVREKLAQDKVDKNPVGKREVIIAGGGDILFLEPMSMRYFTHDLESVRRIINDINQRMLSGMEEYISLSEFYDEIGLSHTCNSDDVGWNIFKDGPIEIDFSATIADDGKPCLMLDYIVPPKYNFSRLG